MTFYPNQFKQGVFKGAVDLNVPSNGIILTAQVGSGQATALSPGQRVKLSTTAGVAMPQIVEAAITEAAIGVVGFQPNLPTFAAGTVVEVLSLNCVYLAEAAGIIAAQATVEGVASQKVQTYSSGASKKHGIAIDAAAASGDLIRVMIVEPTINA